MSEEALAGIVGADNVSYEHATLDEYSRDMSFINTVRPLCVVKPADSDEIQKIIKVLFAFGCFRHGN